MASPRDSELNGYSQTRRDNWNPLLQEHLRVPLRRDIPRIRILHRRMEAADHSIRLSRLVVIHERAQSMVHGAHRHRRGNTRAVGLSRPPGLRYHLEEVVVHGNGRDVHPSS